jgi:hypothetical protein
MSFRRSLIPLSVLLSLSLAHAEEPKIEQLLSQGSFEFPPVSKRRARSEGGDPSKMPVDREWIEFKDDAKGDGGRLIAGLTNEVPPLGGHGRQALFVQFDKVTKKNARAVLSSDLIPVLADRPYRISIAGRVDKSNPVAMDTRLPYLKLRADWFKKVKKTAPGNEEEEEKKEEAAEEARAAAEEKEEAAGGGKAEPSPKGGPTPKAEVANKKDTVPKADVAAQKEAAAKKVEPAKADAEPEEEVEYEFRQTGKMEMRYQPLPGAKQVPGGPKTRPFFVASEWRQFYADFKSPDDAQFLKVTWSWETSAEEGETNGVMYFDGAGIEGVPGLKEDPFKDFPELRQEMEDAENDPDAVRPDSPTLLGPDGKPIEALPITPPKPAKPSVVPEKPATVK